MTKKKLTLITLCFIVTAACIAAPAFAAVRYLPDVTKEMSQAGYWIDKVGDPQRALADMGHIKDINQRVYDRSLMTNDLLNYPATFNGVRQNEDIIGSMWNDAQYLYSRGVGFWKNPESGKWQWLKWDLEEGDDPDTPTAKKLIYRPMVENGVDPGAVENQPVKYAICTTRTCMQIFPSPQELYDDTADPDFSYRTHTVIRVNEPLILRTRSADGKYYLSVSAGMRGGWIPAEDLAICNDREEWLDAWNTDDVLVVCDDKIYTEESNSTPDTAGRKLTMGSRLKLAKESEIQGRISNRTAHNNHVVWMPIRNENGTFRKELALIGENRNVHEGYLPLTTENILKVAMNQLGDTYGWGGMLESEDCSGYMRTVYSCFGLDLPRSINRNNGVLKSWSLEGMTDAKKTGFIRTLPPGSILAFDGHEMMYLGYEGDRLYVISSVSNIMLDGVRTKVRGGVINTLDIKRANGKTWLEALNEAQVPYLLAGDADPRLSLAKAGISGITDRTYTGKAQTQTPVVDLGGITLIDGKDYTVSYHNNRNAGTAVITINGTGAYSDTASASFSIAKAGLKVTADSITIRKGDPAPRYTAKAEGLAAGESLDGLGTIAYSCRYTRNSDAGSYDITPSGLTGQKASNYDITYNSGVLTVKTGRKPVKKIRGTLLAKMTDKGSRSLVLRWTRVQGAEGYDVFFTKCGDMTTFKKVKTVKGNKSRKWTKGTLKKNTSYKAYVKAWVMKDGRKSYVRKSPTVHTYTTGGTDRYTNARSVTVKKATVKLKAGKTYKIKATVNKSNKKKDLLPAWHVRPLRYLSTDTKIAAVSQSGRITAKGAGKCRVYVFAHNGVKKNIKVTVR